MLTVDGRAERAGSDALPRVDKTSTVPGYCWSDRAIFGTGQRFRLRGEKMLFIFKETRGG